MKKLTPFQKKLARWFGGILLTTFVLLAGCGLFFMGTLVTLDAYLTFRVSLPGEEEIMVWVPEGAIITQEIGELPFNSNLLKKSFHIKFENFRNQQSAGESAVLVWVEWRRVFYWLPAKKLYACTQFLEIKKDEELRSINTIKFLGVPIYARLEWKFGGWRGDKIVFTPCKVNVFFSGLMGIFCLLMGIGLFIGTIIVVAGELRKKLKQ